MSAMLAKSFDELQSDVQQRETFDRYRCIWKTDNDRCGEEQKDKVSLATVRRILSIAKLQLDDEQMQRAGHLSLCSNHGEVICIEDVFNAYWMHGVAPDTDSSGARAPSQGNARSADGETSPRDISTRQSQPPQPRCELETMDKSAVTCLPRPPLLTVTSPPPRTGSVRASSASTTPAGKARRAVSAPLQQSALADTTSPRPSPSCLASVGEDLKQSDESSPCSFHDDAASSRPSAPEENVLVESRSANEDALITGLSHGRCPEDNSFSKGPGSEWSPNKVRQEVSELFNKARPSQKNTGTLYLFKARDTTHVKIGYTLSNWRERKSDIEKKSRIALDTNGTHALEEIHYADLLRLEEIVHADLAYFQRDLRLKNSTRVQHEWFEIEFDLAVKTAEFWLKKIRTRGTYLGNMDRVIDGEEKEETNWPKIHWDREKRLEDWDKVTNKPTPWSTFKSAWRRFGMLWFGGCVVIFLAGIAERSCAVAVSVLLMALWTSCIHWVLESGF